MPALDNLINIKNIAKQSCFDMRSINEQIYSNEILLDGCIRDITGQLLKCCEFKIYSADAPTPVVVDNYSIQMKSDRAATDIEIPFLVPIQDDGPLPSPSVLPNVKFYQDYLLANPQITICCVELTGCHEFQIFSDLLVENEELGNEPLIGEIGLDLFCGGDKLDSYTYTRELPINNGTDGYASFQDPMGHQKIELTAVINRADCLDDLEVRPRAIVIANSTTSIVTFENKLNSVRVETTCL